MRLVIPTLLLMTCALAQAAPTEGDVSYDDMNLLLEERGVISRLGSQLKQARNNVGEKASDLVMSAMGFLGVPYRYGGNSADTGFDCSGLVRAVFEQSVGKVLPRRADEQAAATQTIDRSELKPGDLVFFNTMRRAFSHVGIYVGDGKFIHAPRSGASVRVEDMRISYWQTRFNGARRVPLPSVADTASSR
jgi:cell wall-associated NlpC family hydrolase